MSDPKETNFTEKKLIMSKTMTGARMAAMAAAFAASSFAIGASFPLAQPARPYLQNVDMALWLTPAKPG